MGLTFYPIENTAVLDCLRKHLCPFMKAIQKTTKSGFITIDKRESILEEIIRTARSNQINNQLSSGWYHFIRNPKNRTLGSEYDNLVATNLE